MRRPASTFGAYDHLDPAAAADPRNEGCGVLPQESPDTRKSSNEHRSKIGCRNVAARQDERSSAGLDQGFTLDRAIADAFVLRDRHPTACSDLREPDLVLHLGPEVIVVDLDSQSRGSEWHRKAMPTETSVGKEDDLLRRLYPAGSGARSGSPPRSPAACDRNRPRARLSTPPPCTAARRSRLEFPCRLGPVGRRRRGDRS